MAVYLVVLLIASKFVAWTLRRWPVDASGERLKPEDGWVHNCRHRQGVGNAIGLSCGLPRHIIKSVIGAWYLTI